MNINHISVSRKKCYDTCEQKYKFQYHLKVPRPGEEPPYFTYGSIVHRVAEVYVERSGKEKIEKIASDLLKGEIFLDEAKEEKSPWTKMPDEFQSKFKRHVKSLEKVCDQVGFDGKIEHEFEYDLDEPNGKKVLGYIDRLIIRDDKAFIIDYKTTKKGNWQLNSQTVKHDLQLRTYSRVVQKEFGIKPENIKAALFYLEGSKFIGCTYSQDSLIKAETELLNGFINIEKADPDKVWGKVGWHCKNCEYNTMCQFYNPPSKKEAAFDGDLTQLGY